MRRWRSSPKGRRSGSSSPTVPSDPGVYVGEAEQAVWFGGPPVAYIAYPDVKEGESVLLERITARDE